MTSNLHLSVALDTEPGVVSGLRSDRGGDKRISSAPCRRIHAGAAATVVAEGTAFIAVVMWERRIIRMNNGRRYKKISPISVKNNLLGYVTLIFRDTEHKQRTLFC